MVAAARNIKIWSRKERKKKPRNDEWRNAKRSAIQDKLAFTRHRHHSLSGPLQELLSLGYREKRKNGDVEGLRGLRREKVHQFFLCRTPSVAATPWDSISEKLNEFRDEFH